MSVDKKILYITFVDLDKAPGSGSSVRPQRMLAALQEVGGEVKTVSGRCNSYFARHKACKQVRAWLKDWQPDLCYIEPPSGPWFFACDRRLLKTMYRKGIPVGMFYRDFLWLFPEFLEGADTLYWKVKIWLICAMQKRDWHLFQKYCTKLYFSTRSAADYMGCPNGGILPPGCFIPTEGSGRPMNHKVCTAIYVGGATERYGLPLMLQAGALINKNGERLHIKIICAQAGWEKFIHTYPQYAGIPTWLEILHLNSGPELEQQYRESDFSLIASRRDPYCDMAMAVKISEYLSHLLPIVATNCKEMANFIEGADIGLVASDTPEAFAAAMEQMTLSADLREHFYENCKAVREVNLWCHRVETIISDLGYKGSLHDKEKK